jgi:4-amino-4-deoxy-L-arabinose transferase-like glycosyltransferase
MMNSRTPNNGRHRSPLDSSFVVRHSSFSTAASVAFITLAVSTIYGARLARQPIVGEESRWATGAREMLATGDWIVPRQQGRVFPERPPMTMWMMAAVGWLRGEVDAVAIRLPSVAAVVLTSLLVYGYVRAVSTGVALLAGQRPTSGPTSSELRWASHPWHVHTAALSAALVYATMGQVLQIGRLGESESLFALLVGASLLVWHLGYMRGWPPLATWSCGFGFAALAALVKGPQAPVYFVAISVAYLALRRDWHYLVNWRTAAGAAVFAAIVGAWQIPFYLATDWPTVKATWSGLAADRMHLGGLAAHFATYPLETFACWLPWSPLLVALGNRRTRELIGLNASPAAPDEGGEFLRPVSTFVTTAIAVAYPTVWIAAGARGRYFMPLYPVVAVLIGLLIERCATAPAECYPRRAWHQFLLLCGVLIVAGGVVTGGSALLPGDGADWLHQPRWLALLFLAAATGGGYVLWRCYIQLRLAPIVAVTTIGAFVGFAYVAIMINVNAARWNDPTTSVAHFKAQLPPNAALVSFTPIEHRFAYYYAEPIAEIDWPVVPTDLPPSVDYFCFMRYPGDTAQRRAAGRGRTWTTTPGTLPFAWQEITSICVERRIRQEGQPIVVLGRIIRPLRAAVSDATVPQRSAAWRSGGSHRR